MSSKQQGKADRPAPVPASQGQAPAAPPATGTAVASPGAGGQWALVPAYDYPLEDGTIGKLVTSLPNNTGEGRKALFNALQTTDYDSESLPNAPFSVEHIVVHPASKLNPTTGEVETWQRVVLIDSAGKSVSFGSLGVWKAVALLCSFFGPPPWAPPVKVELAPIKTKTGRRFFTLALA